MEQEGQPIPATSGTQPDTKEACLRWIVAFMVDLKLLTAAQVERDCGLPKAAYVSDMAGVQQQFEKDVYGHCWHRLVRYASSPARAFRLGDEVEELAYDACQEATIKFVNRLSKLWPSIDFPTFSHVRAYFFVIARHCLVDILRARKREANATPPAPPAEVMKAAFAKKVPHLASMSSQELRSLVQRWLASLAEDGDRRLIEGRYFESPPTSYKEIAASLNASLPADSVHYTVGQLRVRKHRLTRDLLRCLTEECQSHDV